jgi:hypothetical protein
MQRPVIRIRLFPPFQNIASVASLSVVAFVVFSIFPQRSEASIGVGVQENPVSLANVAQPGQSYTLPSVHVANTGTEGETIRVRVERLSPSHGRFVPPSWIHISNSSMRLSASQGAQIPLELVVPANAKSGRYLSDILVVGSALIPAGSANFGAGAATKLEFTVAPGTGHGLWSSLPPWTWWAMGILLLLALARVAVLRSGLRIRVERVSANRPGIVRSRRFRA